MILQLHVCVCVDNSLHLEIRYEDVAMQNALHCADTRVSCMYMYNYTDILNILGCRPR